MAKVYKMEEGDLQWQFQHSRAKIQFFAGGYANGKTTSAVMKALQLCKDYPGSNGLIARSTYPKLNDTIRKEFLSWCPPAWIARKNLSQDNVVELKNGTVINFRYVQQTGKGNESSTSNLLSATYDWIVVDQIEDPEIGHKDFLDLLGRLRGQTVYQGEDTTMPSTGPRWMILMCNPTRNWVYRELIKPLHDLSAGIKNEKLAVNKDGSPMIELFEGSTYTNAKNLAADYIETQEALYHGQMRKRFLMGEWGAYEGLVYPEYSQAVHTIDHDIMLRYFDEIRGMGGQKNIIEAYDHGIASPACYGFAFTDMWGNVCLLDGFYQKERTIKELADGIKLIHKEYDVRQELEEQDAPRLWADPAVFKRTSGNSRTVGITVAGIFQEEGIRMTRANNDILSGIAKVQSYLYSDRGHMNPFTGEQGAPRLYVSTKCSWFDQEISDYYWKKNSVTGAYEDLPMDRNDHSMDMTKYLFTSRPRIVGFKKPKPVYHPKYRTWRENESGGAASVRNHRYA